jgi:hypothetical protein
MRVAHCAMALTVALAVAPACRSTVDADAVHRGAVHFTVAPSPSVQAPSGRFVSLLDTVRIEVRESPEGSPLIQRFTRLLPRDTVAVFDDIELDDGTYTFTAAVVSTSGALLFSGTTEFTVSRDNFVVDLAVEPTAPVLVLVPDTIRAGVSATFLIHVHNRGRGDLGWSLTHDATDDVCGCAVVVSPRTGILGALRNDSVRVTVRKPASLAIRFRFASKEGSVVVVAQ